MYGSSLKSALAPMQAAHADAEQTAVGSVGPTDTNYQGPLGNKTFLGEPFAVYLAIVLLIVGYKFLSESDAIPGTPANVRISLANTLAITAVAVVGIATLKIATAAASRRFPIVNVTGLPSLVNMV